MSTKKCFCEANRFLSPNPTQRCSQGPPENLRWRFLQQLIRAETVNYYWKHFHLRCLCRSWLRLYNQLPPPPPPLFSFSPSPAHFNQNQTNIRLIKLLVLLSRESWRVDVSRFSLLMNVPKMPFSHWASTWLWYQNVTLGFYCE